MSEARQYGAQRDGLLSRSKSQDGLIKETGRVQCMAESCMLRSFGPPRPNTSDRRVEIIGASISNGLGDMGPAVGCQGWSQVCSTSMSASRCLSLSQSAFSACLSRMAPEAESGQLVLTSRKCIVCGLQTSDALLAYGPLVANHYGASFSLLAWSGAGILRKGGPQLSFSYHIYAFDV